MVTERKGSLQATKGQDGGCGTLARGRNGGRGVRLQRKRRGALRIAADPNGLASRATPAAVHPGAPRPRSERRLDVVPPLRKKPSTVRADLPATIDVDRLGQHGPRTAPRLCAGEDGGGCGGDIHGALLRWCGPRRRGPGSGVSRRRKARRRNRAGAQPADPVRQDVFRRKRS